MGLGLGLGLEPSHLVDGGLIEEAAQPQQLVAPEAGEAVLAPHVAVHQQVVHGEPGLRSA